METLNKTLTNATYALFACLVCKYAIGVYVALS